MAQSGLQRCDLIRPAAAPSRDGLWVGYALPFPVGLLGAAFATAAVAFVIASATLRLRKDYLAIATFGVAITIQLVALNAEPLTGGNQGLYGLPRPFPQWTLSPLATGPPSG